LRGANLGKRFQIIISGMNLSERINAFVKLGVEFSRISDGNPETKSGQKLVELLPALFSRNGWYSEKNVRHRLSTIASGLQKEVLDSWISVYEIGDDVNAKNVGVILAGNIPLVGFDDFRCVLISGNKFTGKIPSDDKILLPLVSEILLELEPRFAEQVVFEDNQLKNIDAIIATGSNNSARYFEHYFAKYPHIIRGNRNGVAVLTGTESKEQFELLGEDIFRYFGLGCRSVTKLFVPENYTFNLFFESIYKFGEEMLNNNKYMNNYDYHKTLYLLSSIPLLDNNFLLLKEDNGISSPPGVVFYERYSSLKNLSEKLEKEKELLQCIVGENSGIKNAISFGTSQLTKPSDYADGVDVMNFLKNLQ
jgi:hypothetical protein